MDRARRSAFILSIATIMLLGGLSPAAAMRLHPVETPRSVDGARVTLTPKYTPGPKDEVLSSTIRVKKGGKTVGAATRVRVGAGQYTVRQVITYRVMNSLKNVPVKQLEYTNKYNPNRGTATCSVTDKSMTLEPSEDFPDRGIARVRFKLACNFPDLSVKPVTAQLTRGYQYEGDACGEFVPCWLGGIPPGIGEPLLYARTVTVDKQTGKQIWGAVKRVVGKPQTATVRYYNRPCVDVVERDGIRRGQTVAQVRNLIGSWGTKTPSMHYNGVDYVTRVYDMCDVWYDESGIPDGPVLAQIAFENHRAYAWLIY